MQPILLASSSIYRRELLARLGLAFEYASPDIDESPLANETPDELVARLSIAKAKALSAKYSQHLIIGSDQVAVLNNRITGKPHSYERAFEQLRAASGKKVIFKTGLCLLNARTGKSQISVEEFEVCFRELKDEQIHHYLTYEQPYDCAGSFKCEGLGIALFKELKGNDPNILIGLPLIRLVDMLTKAGIDPLLFASKQTS
ncbi:Maf-like protein [Cellvibrio zantedeschiae]|uniref:7-methyl-GTP pyrophosphatase n=1 Tax=Cellvibrio zantedeschiae TaxID=1237077 RepID=A0ABQ3AX19_9GAMM|nr:Maf family nucleotide pyrophosphatase [Cellvibrio zantedeschiae]GGY70532.1 Maf-like protein [Cellvibrio zantedeschiae]